MNLPEAAECGRGRFQGKRARLSHFLLSSVHLNNNDMMRRAMSAPMAGPPPPMPPPAYGMPPPMMPMQQRSALPVAGGALLLIAGILGLVQWGWVIAVGSSVIGFDPTGILAGAIIICGAIGIIF